MPASSSAAAGARSASTVSVIRSVKASRSGATGRLEAASSARSKKRASAIRCVPRAGPARPVSSGARGAASSTSGDASPGRRSPHDETDRTVERHEREVVVVLLIPQHGGMIPSLTAVENVLVAARPDERHRLDRALECLQTVKLVTRAQHYPTELSSGERQRVALARALMRPTAVVLVDEPTANLDRQAADELISLLRTLPDEGRTLVAASHDPNLIAQADAVIRLE